MSKKTKQAYGIVEDGLSVKLVHLIKDSDQLYLQAIERIELDNPLYHPVGDGTGSSIEDNPWDTPQSTEEVTIDDFDSEAITAFKLSPFDSMLGGYDLQKGVIALNVSDDNLQILPDVKLQSRFIKSAIKNTISREFFRAGHWQYSIVKRKNEQQVWLHSGYNKLLDLIMDQQKRTKSIPFYKLADSNDIALTDFFKQSLHENSGKTLLVYIGQEYRKAFLFHDQEWEATFPLQITQRSPEPEVIYSKLSLALDNAQVGDPTSIVICGDFATTDTLEYLKIQFPNSLIEFLKLSGVNINKEMQDMFDLRYLVQFALPIALAYKALMPEQAGITKSNFLPSSVIEGQKVFKIAWHGFIILFLIFGMTVFGTIRIMQENLEFRRLKDQSFRLEEDVNRKRLEAAEIKKIRSDLELHQANIEAMRTILEKKNPWTEVLRVLIQDFARRPITWLTNLKQEKEGLFFSGITTERRHVVGISELFPNSRINKVTHSEIRSRSVWLFEINSSMPDIDWFAQIEADLEKLIKMKEMYGEKAEAKAETGKKQSVIQPKQKSTEKVETKKTKEGNLKTVLGAIPVDYRIYPSEKLLESIEEKELSDFKAFLASTERGSTWHYRDLGIKFIRNYSQSQLLTYVRWHLAHRYYLDKEYVYAMQYTEPLIRNLNEFYPYALFLGARIELAAGNGRYREFYGILRSDYSTHRISSLVRDDLEILERR